MNAFAAFVIRTIVRLLHATLRVRHVHPERLERLPRYVMAFWHEHLLLMLHSRYRMPVNVLSSQSKDGDISRRVMEGYGASVVLGSSTRGGMAALRELVRRARAGSNLAFTPDGPRGPRRVAKSGFIAAAQLAEIPIVPIAFAADRPKHLRSWDRMIVPRPFSRVLFLYGEPIDVPRDADAGEWAAKVGETMTSLADEAERDFERLWRNV